MKLYIILCTLLLLSMAAVSAEELTVEVDHVRDEINSGESAQFLVTITSSLKNIREVQITTTDVEWSLPQEAIKVYPEADNKYNLFITPSKYVEPGKIYGVKINVKDLNSGEILYSDILQVNVKTSEKAVSEYRPSVRMVVDMASTIDPREAVAINVKLENLNLLNLSNLILRVSSDISNFGAEQPVQLIALQKKIIELNYQLDPLQAPSDYTLTFDLLRQGEVIESVGKSIVVSTLRPSFEEEEIINKFFFRSDIERTYTSLSNVQDTQTIKISTNLFKSWFTSTIPESYKISEDGQRYLGIDLTLEPGESRQVTIIVSYRILVFLLAIVLAGLIIHYRYKSPIVIRKSISDVNIKEGGISELKVMLDIKSHANKVVKNIVVTDYIPNIADIQRTFSEGTLKPTKIFRHKKKGTILKWELEEIAPGEDLLIRYNLKSKLSIVGDFKMPRAKVNFRKDKRNIIGYSNQVGVSS